jgi:small nuclear ribonucleoprotein (snRNP)-like protein
MPKKRQPKTLLLLLQAMEGYHITIDLRSDVSIAGIIESVDDRMKFVSVSVLAAYDVPDQAESLRQTEMTRMKRS